MKVPAYPETSPSGFRGLGDLPSHWEIIRGRFVMQVNPPAPRLRNLKPENEVSFVPMEAVGEYGGLNLELTRVIVDVSGGYTEFQDGDVIVAKITPCFENGKAALARGLCNGAAYGTTELHVLRSGPTLDRGFLFYVAISDRFRKLGESEMYGAGGQKRVPPEFSKDFPMPTPPVAEQQQIAAFLDWKSGQIDALIARKRELLEKLKEKRLAVITQAVTKGLNPAAPLRDSGIPWLGQVPEHWEVTSLRWFLRTGSGDFITNEDVECDRDESYSTPVIGGNGVMGYTIKSNTKPNGIVVGRVGAHCGNVHLIREKCWVTDNALRISTIDDTFDPEFLFWLLKSLNLNNDANRNAQPLITGETIKGKKVVLPPLAEQKAIADLLDAKTQQIAKMFEKVETAINRLTEYRTALITAATTGKIDVRGVQIPAL